MKFATNGEHDISQVHHLSRTITMNISNLLLLDENYKASYGNVTNQKKNLPYKTIFNAIQIISK